MTFVVLFMIRRRPRYTPLYQSAASDEYKRKIKELLLQYRNFKMYSDYNKVIDNDIKVQSGKSDAFGKAEKDVEEAK